MYVTRPLSLYRNSPSSLSAPPPEGPNSGILVFENEEDKESRRFFGLFKMKDSFKALPFPQNRILRLTHAADAGEFEYSDSLYAVLIPVLNQPLSSNQYFVIDSSNSRKGLACTSSKKNDQSTRSRWCYNIPDAPSQLLHPKNTYQQFQISDFIYCRRPNGFVSKSMAPDGVPPELLRRKGWRAYPKPLDKAFTPTEALGLDAALRARLPDLTVPHNPVVVGKWYCPFIFIRDGEVASQMSNSPYYEMTLQQNWEEIFGCGNSGRSSGRRVDFDVSVEREVVSVAGQPMDGRDVTDGAVWFGSSGVGLSLAIVERVKWEEERAGFEWAVGEFGKGKKYVKVKRREEFKERGEWRKFGCYVLVERFVLKRMDGTLVLTWEFRHTHQITTKWE